MTEEGVDDFLDDESLAEKEFFQQHPGIVKDEGLRHSVTTDTLDSVYLEPTQVEEDVQDILTSIHDLIADPENPESVPTDDGTDVEVSDKTGLVMKEVTIEVTEGNKDVQADVNGATKSVDVSENKEMNISSYFTSQNSEEDPFSSSAMLSVTEENKGESVLDSDTSSKAKETVDMPSEEGTSEIHHHLETRHSYEEPEPVDFQVESTASVMEASLHVIDDKEDFEMFTAENDPDPDFMEYGVSPGNKFLTERMLSEANQNEAEKMGYGRNFDRQLSAVSQHSTGSAHESEGNPFTGSQFSSSQFSPFATPTHQALPPVSEKVLSQLPNKPVSDSVTSKESASVPQPTTPKSPFQESLAKDVLLGSIEMSDSDRETDAWIPADHSAETETYSMPGLIVNEPQGDPVRDLVYRYMGEQEAIKRQVLTVDSVPQDLDGLRKLMEGGCFRSAVDLTGRLLTEAGQGADKVGQMTTHTPHSLQLWFCRLALLMKLRYYSIAESEFQAFHNLDTADLYYEYYPHMYPGRKGSMVPFGMRILHAELPHYLGRSHDALDRLYYVLAVVKKILRNLSDGLSEDGSSVEISEESRKASKELWEEREKQVLYVIGNTFLAIKDYEAAVSVYDSILNKDVSLKADLISGMGRIYLQIGNVPKAKECFKQAELFSDNQNKSVKCRNLVNRGLEGMCLNNFSEAYQCFKQAVELDPTNSSAVNNMAVCSLYLGKLMDALKSLEVLVHEDPDRNLHEGVLFNLCTLYELESSRALHKKQALLDLVSRYKGDGFPVACLKMA